MDDGTPNAGRALYSHSVDKPVVLYAAADLIWATRIKATADALGVACRPVRSLAMLEARLADSTIGALIVDLEAGGLAFTLMGRVMGGESAGKPGKEGGIRVLAFGPHVAVDAMDRARAAGADAVLARGAFDRRLPEILRELGTPGDDSNEPRA
jgi:hypothetical protein